MNDKTEFSFEIALNQPAPGARDADLFAFDDCKAYELPDRKLLLRNPHNGKSAVVMREVLTALHACRRFRTLEEHVAEVGKAIPALRGKEGEIRQVLDAMRAQGMLVGARDLAGSLAGDEHMAAEASATDAAIVVIITWERPVALERLLKSIHERGDPAAVERLYIVDDSRTAENIGKNREVVRTAVDGSPFDIRYFGREEQEKLLRAITAQAPEVEESLRFLADASRWSEYWTSGLARNYALLLSVGKRLVVLDDDTLFEVHEPNELEAGVRLAGDTFEAEFFGEASGWPTLQLRKDTDPVRAHLECLGAPLSAALQRMGGGSLPPESLAGATAGDIRRLRPDVPVLITQCGVLGDPATGDSKWLLELDARSRNRMLASEEAAEQALSNRNLWVGRRRAHIVDRSTMSGITGLDHRHLLPPYFPSLRSEDQIFGALAAYLYPDLAVLDYPWAIPHLPVEARDRGPVENDFEISQDFPMFHIGWLRSKVEFAANSEPLSRLKVLSELLSKLAQNPGRELQELHTDHLAQSACSALVDLESALADAGDAPENWKGYLKASLQSVNRGLTVLLRDVKLSGVPKDVQGDELVDVWRVHWRDFGQALEKWPDIREAAAHLDDSSGFGD